MNKKIFLLVVFVTVIATAVAISSLEFSYSISGQYILTPTSLLYFFFVFFSLLFLLFWFKIIT